MSDARSQAGEQRAEELTFIELIKVLTQYRLVLIGVASTAMVIAALYAFLSTPIYRAEVLIAAADESSTAGGALSSMMSRLGGITSLMGMGRMGRRDQVTEGVVTLQSPQFTIEFITDNNLLPVLFPSRWDPEAKAWNTTVESEIPTLEDGYMVFNEKIRSVVEDDNGIVRITIEWRDPVQAAEWANALIHRLNERLRKRAIDEANQTIDYLNKEVEKTRIVELQQAIYFMIENQINVRTMANVREEFAFKVISPAIAPDMDRYVKPRRVFIMVIGTVVGVAMGIFSCFLLFAIKRIRAELG